MKCKRASHANGNTACLTSMQKADIHADRASVTMGSKRTKWSSIGYNFDLP